MTALRNWFCLTLYLLSGSICTAQINLGKAYFSDPALSPDGTEIAFVSGGDIWTVSTKGGEARLLISNPATESRPVYSPDGKFIAFNSSRSGNGDIYTMNLESGELTRITYDDAPEEVSGWSSDGYIYFSSTSKDIAGYRDVYRIKYSGGSAMLVSDNRYVSEYQGVPSPDGKTIALVAHGVGSNQWWRNGRSHLDESDIWLMKPGLHSSYEQFSKPGAKQLWPMWGNRGDGIYYVSDLNGHQNIWHKLLSGTPKQLTNFTNGLVLWPSISDIGNKIVFERNFSIWLYDIVTGDVKIVDIKKHGSPAGLSTEHLRLNAGFEDLAVSPDGRKVAFVAHGDVFVASSKDGGDAARITFTTAKEHSLKWASNSNGLVYVSGREGIDHLFEYNFITGKETQLTNDTGDDASPIFSPDGKMLAFLRNGKELRSLNLATKQDVLIAKGYLGRAPFTATGTVAWSPDGKWLAFAAFGTKALRNIYVVPSQGGEAKPISFLANSFGGNVLWGQDGKSIYFETGQRTENSNIARVDVVPQQPRFREDQFKDLFIDPLPSTTPITKKESLPDSLLKNPNPKVKESMQIVWEGLRQRLSLLPLGVSVDQMSLSKDGNSLVISTSVAGQQNLYTYSLDELSKEPAVLKQITSTPSNKSNIQFSADGKDVWYLENGRIQSVSIDSRIPKPLAITAEMDVDFNQEKMEVFKEAWDVQDKGYYDPGFHGADWKSVRKIYEPLAAGAQTPDELRRIISLMIGELNSSHSGISGPIPPNINTGRIGVRFDREKYESSGKLKISEVLSMSPAALAGIKVGDYLEAADGTTITSQINIDHLLENKINRRVLVKIGSEANGGSVRDVSLRPVNLSTEKGLLYKQWVQQQRDYISSKSHGRLGYVHMIDMSQQSLEQLYLDMDAENHSREGVVVDIRNNNGGFVNAYALDVLSRKGYMTMTIRGLPSSPARVSLGQRSLEAPTILVTNQHSLSDAEDFAEGYRTLGLGKVVGEPTAGWIIYTTAVQLIDGSVIRLPTIKVSDHAGKDMELAPRPVDIEVSNPLGEKGKDTQLDMAVQELLKQIDSAKK